MTMAVLTAVTLRSSAGARSAWLRSPSARRTSRLALCSLSTSSNATLPLSLAVRRSIDAHVHGLSAGSPVLISVSGGSDSVALLRVLVELNSELRWDLSAIHFNHGLRSEADEEEEFVRSLTARYGMPVHVRRLADDARTEASGVQERTRAWRRAESLALLSELGSAPPAAPSGGGSGGGGGSSGSGSDGAGGGLGQVAAPCGAILLGHHADDQLETILLKGLRGCHLSNLHGMRWQVMDVIGRQHDQRPLPSELLLSSF